MLRILGIIKYQKFIFKTQKYLRGMHNLLIFASQIRNLAQCFIQI